MINQAAAPAQAQSAPVISNASTVSQPAPVAPASTADITLPKTGPENIVMGGLGLGSIVAAGAAYMNSRRELLGAFLKR